MPNNKIILLGSTFHHLHQGLGEFVTAKVEIKVFDDQEIKPILPVGDLKNKEIVYIQSTYSPATNVLEFILTVDALKRLDPKPQEITIIAPYFSYVRQDKIDLPGTPISLEVLASFIPKNFHFKTIDLHNPQSISFFKCQAQNVLPVKAIADFLKIEVKEFLNNAQVVAPDKGAKEKAKLLFSQLNLNYPLIQINKKRDPVTGNVEILGFEGEIKAKTAIIWDDLFTSGRTILGEIDYLKARGMDKFIFIISHPLFFKVKLTKLTEILKAVDMLVITDSIPAPSGEISPKIKIIPLNSFLKEII
jgi:ribose-phosphate pyrophosphokinase